MKYIIEINNLRAGYHNKIILDNFSLKIKENSWTTITGPIGSGKSTLLKVLIGLHPYEGSVIINNYNLKEDIKKIRAISGVVFEHSDESFVAETVLDEMAFVLENMNLTKSEIKKRVFEVAKQLNIEKLLDKNPYLLSNGEKQYVALAAILVMKPKILFLDEALTKINNCDRESILKILRQYQKGNNMTIVNVTHDMEESLYGDELILINKGKIILSGPKELVYKEENVFNKLGIDLPFIVKLCHKLKYYQLVDDIILDKDKLVDIIWK
ncbi:MAG: ATP-binding cassette domain-containing protein [Bacilli bacterium]|nr:ATP-binding cassette domain-containing protein [Bacilli bacterium]